MLFTPLPLKSHIAACTLCSMLCSSFSGSTAEPKPFFSLVVVPAHLPLLSTVRHQPLHILATAGGSGPPGPSLICTFSMMSFGPVFSDALFDVCPPFHDLFSSIFVPYHICSVLHSLDLYFAPMNNFTLIFHGLQGHMPDFFPLSLIFLIYLHISIDVFPFRLL